MLTVSGELDHTLGGKPESDENKSLRRGVYLLQKRQKPPMVQLLFDGPTGATESCPRRVESETPLSALFLLNNPFALERARAFAERVCKIAGNDRTKQIDAAFRLALLRLPNEKERKAIAAFFEKADQDGDKLEELCHALLCATEFLTID